MSGGWKRAMGATSAKLTRAMSFLLDRYKVDLEYLLDRMTPESYLTRLRTTRVRLCG